MTAKIVPCCRTDFCAVDRWNDQEAAQKRVTRALDALGLAPLAGVVLRVGLGLPVVDPLLPLGLSALFVA